MSVRLLLQFNQAPSHALTIAEPWTCWLVETESPSRRGRVIGREIAMRKVTNGINVITAIEIEQIRSDAARPQLYLDACAWWLHRAPFDVERLPVKLVATNYNGSLVSVNGWRLGSLSLSGLSTPLDLTDIHHLFPDLESLSLAGGPAAVVPVTAQTLLSKLAVARQLHLHSLNIQDYRVLPLDTLEVLDLSGCANVTSLSFLAGAPHLREVNISATLVSDLSPLRECPSLRKLVAVECKNLIEVISLRGAPALEELVLTKSAVTNLNGLGNCRRLRSVNVSRCHFLRDLSPLNGAPCLERIDAPRVLVEQLDVRDCPSLKEVNVTQCELLRSLTSLAGSQSLEVITANGSPVKSLTGLNTCSRLRSLSVVSCNLNDLSPLAGSVSLREIDASMGPAHILTGLNTCKNLVKVTFIQCPIIIDLSPLAGAPALAEINAAGSGVVVLNGLNTCLRLRKVNFHMCESLRDLSPLGGAPSLEKIKAARSGVANVEGLDRCPKLVALDLDGTPAGSLYATTLRRLKSPDCVAF